MKKLFIIGSLLAAIGLTVWAWAARSGPKGHGRVEVIGDIETDFGEILEPGTILSHEFLLKNRTGVGQKIAGVSKSCGCIEAHAVPELLPPGGEAALTVSLDSRVAFGARQASAFVRFEDASIPQVGVSVKAFIRPDYHVRLEPQIVEVPRGAASGTWVQKDIKISEVLSHEADYKRPTEVKGPVGDKNFLIDAVEPWENHGWHLSTGYLRTTTVKISYRVPVDWQGKSFWMVPLNFTKAATGGDLPAMRQEVELSICRI